VQPPASLKALGDPIYEAFYGLNEQPFAISTDPRFFYLSAAHQRAFSELLNGLRRRESLMLLTGDSGTGKTTLCRAVLQTLGERTFSAIILNPYMAGAEVLRIVLRDFGLVTNEDLRRGALANADVPQLLDTLEGFLKSLLPLGSHAVIVMDEAQSLAPAILDQIRVLTGLEHNRQRLVQVILCGQPGLLQTLKVDALHALNERITRRVELPPLPSDETRSYIEHRLGVAGGGQAVAFEPAATLAVAELSRGLPRRINVLCDRALQEGRIEGVNVITTDLVKRAARALAGVHDPTPVAPAEPVIHAVPPPEPDLTTSDGLAEAAMAAAGAPARELTFAQELERPSRGRAVILGTIGAVALIAAGFVWWARSAGTPQAAIPAPPARPASLLKMPSGPLPVPSQDEMDALLQQTGRPAAALPPPPQAIDTPFTPVAPPGSMAPPQGTIAPPAPSAGPAPESAGPGPAPASANRPDDSQ
jgi:general secretion pathway protein A